MTDNATNFVGAKNELFKLSKHVQENIFQNYLNSNKILWKFIPSRSPHFGGIWESAVKSAKYHLQRVGQNINFTYEEFNTLIIQIEAVLNSRPLFPLSNDPNDLQPLTPGHFLIGEPLNALPQDNLQQINVSRLTRYQHLQKMLQHFWSRWSLDYLHHLQQRNKWRATTSTDSEKFVGRLVLLKEDNTHPLQWQLGRVSAVHPGTDGVIRVLSVKIRSGVVKRAINKICLLPID